MHLLSVNLRFNFLGHFERLEDSLSNMLKKNLLLVLLISNHTLTGAIIFTKVHYVTLYKECNVTSFTHADMRAKFCIHGAECLLGHLDQETAENSSTGSARLNTSSFISVRVLKYCFRKLAKPSSL